jgi:hypothetical protein
MVPRTGNPGISLVFREMWDSTTPSLSLLSSDALRGQHLWNPPTRHLLGNEAHQHQAACAGFASRLPNTHQITAENTPIAVPELNAAIHPPYP